MLYTTYCILYIQQDILLYYDILLVSVILFVSPHTHHVPYEHLTLWDGWVLVKPFFKVLRFDVLATIW